MKNDVRDHRAKVTKMLIREAFLKLLSQKAIENITVTELCELAMISRGTFYAHYADIFNLREAIETEMEAEFIKALDATMEDSDDDSLNYRTSQIFQCIKDNADLCIVTLGEFGDKDFAKRLLSHGQRKALEEYKRYAKHLKKQDVDYFYAFISSGCIGLMQKWFEEGMNTPPKEIANIAEFLIKQAAMFFEQKDGIN